MNEEGLEVYELKMSFQATNTNADAFYQALAQIAEAWSRHHRLKEAKLELKEISKMITED
ncbi:MAG: hypothetical protein SFT81_01345 [Candidatus Caenarcaniphilales bacterium]|nr:hypothetical protein [Candidatus Caenarcaniphilales bacterium]